MRDLGWEAVGDLGCGELRTEGAEEAGILRAASADATSLRQGLLSFRSVWPRDKG